MRHLKVKPSPITLGDWAEGEDKSSRANLVGEVGVDPEESW